MRSRPRAAVAAVAALGALVVLLLAVTRSSAPAVEAERLVASDVLLYVHASTDPGRDQDAALLERLERLPGFRALRARFERSLSPRKGGFRLERDVRPWLGDEAALAVTPRGTLALLAVEDEDRAQGVLRRVAGGGRAAVRHRGVLVRRFRGAAAAFVDGFLAVGPQAEVTRVIDLAGGRGTALADRKDFRRVTEERAEQRVVDVWAGPGARRLAGGSGLLSRLPEAAAVGAVTPVQDGLEVDLRVLGEVAPQFDTELPEAVGEDALAYVGLRSLRPLVALLPRTGPAAEQFIGALQPLVDALDREVALTVSPAEPDPVVTLIGRAGDPDRARVALGSLQGVVAQLLTGTEADTGQVPTFQERDLGDGLTGFALTLAGGGELVTAVKDDRVAISNAEDGVRRAVGEGDSIEDAERFRETVGEVPGRAEAVGYLALSQLLELGERAGLAGSAAFAGLRDDLRKIRAAGAVVQGQGTDTTAKLTLQIP